MLFLFTEKKFIYSNVATVMYFSSILSSNRQEAGPPHTPEVAQLNEGLLHNFLPAREQLKLPSGGISST